MFDAADLDEANSVCKICRTNLTGFLSPDLLFVYVSNILF